MPIEKKVEHATRSKRSSRAASSDESSPPPLRRSTRATSSEKSPPASRRLSVALAKIPEETPTKPSTPNKNKAKDDVPTVGTPKRRGRASMNPATVASPVRVTRRSVAALADEAPAVSSPRRKSRASINPSAIASPARVTRKSVAVPETAEPDTIHGHIGSRSKRKSTLVKGKSETVDEVETEKVPDSFIIKEEGNPERCEKSDQVDADSKQSSSSDAIVTPETKISTRTSPNAPSGSVSADDKTPETNVSTRSNRNSPSGSESASDNKTPETKIPTRSGRSTPSRSGSSFGEVRTPTRSQRGSRPSTPEDSISKRSPKRLSELKTPTKPSPDRHANCSSRDSSPVFASRDLRRSSFSSPIRYSPRSSPSRRPRHSSGESKESVSVETKPTSPLASRNSSSPLNSKNSHSPRSSPSHKNAAKVKEVSVPEKHYLEEEEENDSLMMPSKRIKRDTADGVTAPSPDVELLKKHHSPQKELGSSPKEENADVTSRLEPIEGNSGASPRPEEKGEDEEHSPNVNDTLKVDEDNRETCLNIPGISKLSGDKTSLRDLKTDGCTVNLEPTVVSDETSIRIHTLLTKNEGSGKSVEKPSSETLEESVKEVVNGKKEKKDMSPILVSPATKTPSLSCEKPSSEANEILENHEKNELSPASDREPQVLELKEENCESAPQDSSTTINIPSADDANPTRERVGEEGELEVEIAETEGKICDQVKVLVNAEVTASEEEVSPNKGETEDKIYDQAKVLDAEVTASEEEVSPNKAETDVDAEAVAEEELVNSESPVSKITDVTKGTIPTAEGSLELSCSKSEEVKIFQQGEPMVNDESQNENSSDAIKEELPANKELVVSPVKSEGPSDCALDKSTLEHIVDEGYSETSDSEYPSSVVGLSDKDVKVPSIVEGLGIKEAKQDIPADVSVSAGFIGKLFTGFSTMENIVEDNEEACEISPIPAPTADISGTISDGKQILLESGQACTQTMDGDDQLVSSGETKNDETTVGTELENIVEDNEEACEISPIPAPSAGISGTISDGKQILLELGQACTKTMDGDDQLVSSDETKNDDETTVGAELENTDQQDHPSYASPLRLAVSPDHSEEDCSLSNDVAEHGLESVSVENKEVNVENVDTTTVLDTLGLKRCVQTSETKEVCEEEKNESVLRGPRDRCGPEICDNDTASVGDDDGEKKHEVPSENEKKIICEGKLEGECCPEIYENDNASVGDSGEETANGSDFLDDEAEEGDESDNDENVYEISDESDDSDVELLDESCVIIEAMEEKCVEKSSKLDKPVFQVSEICHSDEPTVGKDREFASAAASHFVTDRKTDAKSGALKSSSKSSLFASSAASQFVVSETASNQPEIKKPEVVKLAGASSGSPPKSDSSFTSSDQEQENSEKIPKSIKRAASEGQVLKEKKKFKKDLNQQPEMCSATKRSGFRVKLCNIAPKTTEDDLRKSLHEFGIATGLQSFEFCPRIEKHKKTAIATYDSKKNLEKALSRYGKVMVHGRRIFFLLDDETDPISDSKPSAASPKMSPRKKFVGIISDLPKEVTIGDIITAYEQEGIKCINKVKMYKLKSSKDDLNFAKLEFSKKTALLKAIIITENIEIRGNRVSLKIKEKPSS